uniref:Secreted protein n=1 Tax=Plectus sambesii TaxID=2011161 RepID=A0A914WTG7_9BILA
MHTLLSCSLLSLSLPPSRRPAIFMHIDDRRTNATTTAQALTPPPPSERACRVLRLFRGAKIAGAFQGEPPPPTTTTPPSSSLSPDRKVNAPTAATHRNS